MKIINSKQKLVILPGSLDARGVGTTTVQHGLLRVQSKVEGSHTESIGKGTSSNPYIVGVSSHLARELYLIKGVKYRLVMSGGVLKFGPLTGMLVRNDTFTRKHGRARIHERLGGAFVTLSRDSFRPKNGLVKGRVYIAQQKKWIQATVPLPEVLFIRCSVGGRKRRKILSTYKTLGGLVFNSNIYNKRTVERRVSNIKSVSNQIIKSKMIKSKSDVLAFLDQHNEAVIKPKNGRKGNGIFFVKKVKDGYRVYDYRAPGQSAKFFFTKSEFMSYLSRVRADRGRYMAQRWIKFMKKDGRPFDMRVFVQKEDQKNWKCTGIMTRVAGKGKKITNRSRGGRFVTADKLFNMYPPKKKRELMKKVSTFAEQFGYALDRAFPTQHFADVGLDIGMDKNENLHFMEVNFVAQYQTVRRHNRKMFNNLCWKPLIHASDYQGFPLQK